MCLQLKTQNSTLKTRVVGRPKRRRLGQNFLVDSSIADRITAALADGPPRVLEIGPGKGSLTESLLQRFDRIIGLEFDEQLLPHLQQRFGGRRLQVIHDDAMTIDLDTLLAAESPWQVASNLPYSVGTAILRRLLPRHDLVTRLVVMLQREVAHRVVAQPGGKGHGLLALERAAWAEARVLFDVHPSAFRPRPKVESSVVALDLKAPEHEAADLDRALRLAAEALTRPRKMLRNAFRTDIDPAQIEAAGLDASARPGTVTLEGWVRLARGA